MGWLGLIWRRTPSITIKFLALLVPAVVAITTAFCVIFYYQKYAALRRGLTDGLETATQAHAAMLAMGMWSLDEPSIRAAVRALAAGDGVVCVEAVDELIARRYRWPEAAECGVFAASGEVSREIVITGRRIGLVTAHYSDAGLREAIKGDVAGAVSLALLVLAGALAAALAAHRVAIGRPLRHFLAHVARAERGHDRSAVVWDCADEMGRVIAAYNRLVARLAEDETALAKERNTLQATLDNVDQGVLMVDGGLRVVLFNRRAAELLEVAGDFLAARPLFVDLVAFQSAQGAFADAVADFDLHPDGVAQALRRPVAFKRRRPDGMVLEARSRPLDGGGFVRTLTDVTAEARAAEEMVRAMEELETAYHELKETQASLLQAEKMASLAMLVTGVAHEINTPVGIAFSCAGHLSAKTRELTEALKGPALKRSLLTAYAAQAAESARLIEQNLGRAAGLIQSFKEVAVDQTSQERRVFDLAAYLGEVAASLQPRVRESGCRVALNCPPGLTMDSYPGALAQIVANLVINAQIHAFDDGRRADGRPGTVTLSADDAEDGDWLRLVCADDGRGVAAAHLPRLFEPFFTTKRGAGGSGLGLHIVYNLVVQTLGGRIDVENAASGGAVFTIRLPKSAPVADKPPQSARGAAA